MALKIEKHLDTLSEKNNEKITVSGIFFLLSWLWSGGAGWLTHQTHYFANLNTTEMICLKTIYLENCYYFYSFDINKWSHFVGLHTSIMHCLFYSCCLKVTNVYIFCSDQKLWCSKLQFQRWKYMYTAIQLLSLQWLFSFLFFFCREKFMVGYLLATDI